MQQAVTRLTPAAKFQADDRLDLPHIWPTPLRHNVAQDKDRSSNVLVDWLMREDMGNNERKRVSEAVRICKGSGTVNAVNRKDAGRGSE